MTEEAPLAPADQAAKVAEQAGRDFRAGEISREQFLQLLGHVLGMAKGTTAKAGPLRAEGRLSFGRANEGTDGVAVWVPASELPDEWAAGAPVNG